ncbi:MAG: zinc-binding alcohol dehydrogenase [Nanoarchaeota archaeon]
MKQVFKTPVGKIILQEISIPTVKPGFVLVKTLYSLISSGTETRAIAESDGFFTALLKKGKSFVSKKHTSLHSPLGYCVVGIIVESDTHLSNFKKGDHVVCAGHGYAVHAEFVCVPQNLVCKIPAGVELRDATFTAIASIALHSLRRSHVQLGETALVVGLGLTGQLASQLLRLSGCTVLGIDPHDYKISLAQQLGLDFALQGKDHFQRSIMDLTQQRGVDAAIICTDISSKKQFEEIASAVRDKGRIVTLGHVRTTLPSSILFRREIDLLSSRSFGPGRFDSAYEEQGVDYPFGYVRWTEKRNMEEILRLLQRKLLRVQPLITHTFPFTDAPQAYQILLSKKRPIALLLTYQS